MKPEYTMREFVDKLDWEGGVGGMVGYQGSNLDAYDLPKEFKEKWARLCELYDSVQDDVTSFEDQTEGQ